MTVPRRAPDEQVVSDGTVARDVIQETPDRAVAIAGTIARPDMRAQALAGIARAVAAAGDPDRAEAIARTITDTERQVRTLLGVAEIDGVPGACRLIARAFAMGPWHVPVPVLAKLQPDVVLQIATDVARHPGV